jgi:hypothetical protein
MSIKGYRIEANVSEGDGRGEMKWDFYLFIGEFFRVDVVTATLQMHTI